MRLSGEGAASMARAPRGLSGREQPRERGLGGAGRRAGWGEPEAGARRAGAFRAPPAPRGWWGDGGDGFPTPPPRTPMAERSGPPPPASPPREPEPVRPGGRGAAKGRREGGGCVVQAAAAAGGGPAGGPGGGGGGGGSRVARSSRRGSPRPWESPTEAGRPQGTRHSAAKGVGADRCGGRLWEQPPGRPVPAGSSFGLGTARGAWRAPLALPPLTPPMLTHPSPGAGTSLLGHREERPGLP